MHAILQSKYNCLDFKFVVNVNMYFTMLIRHAGDSLLNLFFI